jgi:hypothetical protein
MKLNTDLEVEEFLQTVTKCKGDVYLLSLQGDRINLKSSLSQYVAIGELIKGEVELDLFCTLREDEVMFYKFFQKHEDTI